MKKLLLTVSVPLFLVACSQRQKVAPTAVENTSKKEVETDKEEIRVIEHSSPNPTGLDSLKKAKLKKKYGG